MGRHTRRYRRLKQKEEIAIAEVGQPHTVMSFLKNLPLVDRFRLALGGKTRQQEKADRKVKVTVAI